MNKWKKTGTNSNKTCDYIVEIMNCKRYFIALNSLMSALKTQIQIHKFTSE